MVYYSLLPPGRRRGLAYTEYLLSRSRDRNRNRTRINITRANPLSSYYELNISPITRYRDNYDILSSLEDVKIGLISKDLLNKSKITFKKYEGVSDLEVCIICQDNIEENDIIRRIDCSHIFHVNCIDTWFAENKKCPMCKFEI